MALRSLPAFNVASNICSRHASRLPWSPWVGIFQPTSLRLKVPQFWDQTPKELCVTAKHQESYKTVCVEWYSPHFLGFENDENVGLLKEWSKSRRTCIKLKATVCSSWNIHTRNSDLQAQFYKLSQCTDLSVGSLETRCFNSSCCCANKCISSLLIFLIVAAQIPPLFETSIHHTVLVWIKISNGFLEHMQFPVPFRWWFGHFLHPKLPTKQPVLSARARCDGSAARDWPRGPDSPHGRAPFPTSRNSASPAAGSGLEGLVANLEEDLPEVEDIPDITSQ